MKIVVLAVLGLLVMAIAPAFAQSHCTTTCYNVGSQRVCNTNCY
jgi:hypothetical protein